MGLLLLLLNIEKFDYIAHKIMEIFHVIINTFLTSSSNAITFDPAESEQILNTNILNIFSKMSKYLHLRERRIIATYPLLCNIESIFYVVDFITYIQLFIHYT